MCQRGTVRIRHTPLPRTAGSGRGRHPADRGVQARERRGRSPARARAESVAPVLSVNGMAGHTEVTP
jgi:hypothetical protein